MMFKTLLLLNNVQNFKRMIMSKRKKKEIVAGKEWRELGTF